MSTLTIPTDRAADVPRAKDFLFSVFGERRWSEDEYLGLSANTNRLIELSERRLRVEEMPTDEHQDVVWNVGETLKAWARLHGGRSFVAPFPVRLWPGKFREPDAFLYSSQRLNLIQQQYGGPPDLAVEILSPGTEEVDRGDKEEEYARAGIPEYWIVDLEARVVEQRTLEGERYRPQRRYSEGEVLRSAHLPGLEVPVERIFRY